MDFFLKKFQIWDVLISENLEESEPYFFQMKAKIFFSALKGLRGQQGRKEVKKMNRVQHDWRQQPLLTRRL